MDSPSPQIVMAPLSPRYPGIDTPNSFHLHHRSHTHHTHPHHFANHSRPPIERLRFALPSAHVRHETPSDHYHYSYSPRSPPPPPPTYSNAHAPADLHPFSPARSPPMMTQSMPSGRSPASHFHPQHQPSDPAVRNPGSPTSAQAPNDAPSALPLPRSSTGGLYQQPPASNLGGPSSSAMFARTPPVDVSSSSTLNPTTAAAAPSHHLPDAIEGHNAIPDNTPGISDTRATAGASGAQPMARSVPLSNSAPQARLGAHAFEFDGLEDVIAATDRRLRRHGARRTGPEIVSRDEYYLNDGGADATTGDDADEYEDSDYDDEEEDYDEYEYKASETRRLRHRWTDGLVKSDPIVIPARQTEPECSAADLQEMHRKLRRSMERKRKQCKCAWAAGRGMGGSYGMESDYLRNRQGTCRCHNCECCARSNYKYTSRKCAPFVADHDEPDSDSSDDCD